MKQLKITVSPEGEVSVEVQGVAGASCLDDTKFLEAALGGVVKSQVMTSEYYQAAESVMEVKS